MPSSQSARRSLAPRRGAPQPPCTCLLREIFWSPHTRTEARSLTVTVACSQCLDSAHRDGEAAQLAARAAPRASRSSRGLCERCYYVFSLRTCAPMTAGSFLPRCATLASPPLFEGARVVQDQRWCQRQQHCSSGQVSCHLQHFVGHGSWRGQCYSRTY